jgi:FKBP-type peptidyl-prolyl cis-trans isomerase FkpA
MPRPFHSTQMSLMTKPALCCAALLWPVALVSAKDAAPATASPATPPAAAPAPELPPAEAKKRLSQALGTYFGTRQKSMPAVEGLDIEALKKGLSDVLASGNKSYALGAQFAGQLVHDGLEVSPDELVAAFGAVMDGKEPLVTQQQVNDEIQKIQARLRQKQQEQAAKEASKNEAAGKEFLDKNRTAEGVQVTESGLQYLVLQPAKDADAKRPSADDTVVCHYRGTLLDGTEFDKSPENEPRSFGLRGVIKGWTEGIPMMQVGSKYRFWVPASLAYGANPRPGGVIKPGHTLVFDVELVSIAPPTASAPPTPGVAGRPNPAEKAVATTPPIAVEMKDGKPVVRQVTPEQEAEAIRKAQEAEKAKKK